MKLSVLVLVVIYIATCCGHPVVDTAELHVKIIPLHIVPVGYESPRFMKVDVYDPDSPTIRITKGPPQILGNIRGARLHVAPGAYPVYYALARANGKFNGKYIRALSPAEIASFANSL